MRVTAICSIHLLADLSPGIMAEYRDRRLRIVKPATVMRELSILSAVLETDCAP
ncbi:MAG: hypothetical protein LBI59_02560 [Candidatus Accumulibacter sp.]|jgi:hypothetical protein|nr:hypothetical protein [Accumulibacter sp.]